MIHDPQASVPFIAKKQQAPPPHPLTATHWPITEAELITRTRVETATKRWTVFGTTGMLKSPHFPLSAGVQGETSLIQTW